MHTFLINECNTSIFGTVFANILMSTRTSGIARRKGDGSLNYNFRSERSSGNEVSEQFHIPPDKRKSYENFDYVPPKHNSKRAERF